jgi:hypothetical protein
MSQQVREVVFQLHARAQAQGTGEAFIATLRVIQGRLERAPAELGEPLFRLPAMRLLVYSGIVSSVVVTYAVHETLPLVVIWGVKVLFDS